MPARPRKRRLAWLLMVLWLIPLAAAARPAGADPAGPAAAVAGLRCLGADTMQTLLASWASGFNALQPPAPVEVGAGTRYSAAGVAAVLAGTANCVSFAREPFPAERAAFRRRLGRALVVVPVAGGSFATPHGSFALAVYVNRANPLRGLSLAQLAALFSGRPAPGQARPPTHWGQLGLHGSWAGRPIHLYGMTSRRDSGSPPGIVNFLDQRVLRGQPWRAGLRVQVDTPGSTALAAIVRQVGRDPDSIGYSGFGYATPAVRALPLSMQAGDATVAGSPATVAAGRYALAREIYLGFPATAAGGLAPAACRFLAYALSPAGQRQVMRDRMRFLPLTPAQRRGARAGLVHDCGATVPPASAAHPAYLDRDGAVRIVGYNDMRWMLQAIDRHYAQRYPGVRFRLILKGTRTAPAALADGSSLFAPMGAEFLPAALAAYRRQVGSEPLQFRVAHAALDPRARSSPLAIYVHPGNPLSSISLAQLRRVFTDTAPLASWGQLGLGGTWARRPIHPCGLAPDTALGRYMRRHRFDGKDYAAGYTGYRESERVLQRVAADPDALCFADLNQANPAVRVLGIRLGAGQGVSTGSRADIVSGRYPLDRYLYVYARAARVGQRDRLPCRYLQLLLSASGQRLLAAARPGYLPLSPAQLAAERARARHLLCGPGMSSRPPGGRGGVPAPHPAA
ncbi:PstS family phosphate ABC transporter substrate-binding protein [Rhodanobacter terrae]|uniref:PstS family phosphate ABC transporter substrate-binding protein n=1 Tax=Rhodanobacter terrae TaxID=418647 RepID=A0ABW0T057_9GAMM